VMQCVAVCCSAQYKFVTTDRDARPHRKQVDVRICVRGGGGQGDKCQHTGFKSLKLRVRIS